MLGTQVRLISQLLGPLEKRLEAQEEAQAKANRDLVQGRAPPQMRTLTPSYYPVLSALIWREEVASISRLDAFYDLRYIHSGNLSVNIFPQRF